MQRFRTRERRGDSAGWCKLFADLRGGVFGCHRQGIAETWSAINRDRMTLAERAALAREVAAATREREQQQRAEWAVNAKRNASLWAQCVPVTHGDPLHRYLCRRLAIDAFEAPSCLRLHPALDYWHDGDKLGAFPTMVALLTAPDGRTVALHRTFLTDDGRKADVPTVKKLTRAAGPAGWRDDPARVAHAAACLASQRASKRRWALRWLRGCRPWRRTARAAWRASVARWRAAAGYLRRRGFDGRGVGRRAEGARSTRVAAGQGDDTDDDGADWCDVWAARGAMLMEGGA